MMRNTQWAAAACVLSLAGAAHADVKVVQKTTIQNPQLTAMIQSMSPAQRAQMAASGTGALLGGAPVTSVIYTHGGEARVDIGPETMIVNAATHKMITLNRTAHTYSISAYIPRASAPIKASVRATGQSQMIAGHRARRYLVTLSNPQMQGGAMTGDIWSAPDLPQPPATLFSSGPAAALQGELRTIKGMPLLVNLTLSGSPIGATNVRSITTTVSQRPLPPSVFAIPAGYKRVASAAPAAPGGLP